MENPSEKRKNDVSNQTNEEIIYPNIIPPQPPSWAEEDTTENKRRFMFRGTDMTQVPCFKQTFMNGIGSMMVVGVGYNLATSRNPMKISMITYCTVVLSSWVYCRINRARSKYYVVRPFFDMLYEHK